MIRVTVFDSRGRTVRHLARATIASATHTLVWDGKNNQGVAQPEGKYKIKIAANDANGEPLQAVTGVIGKVTGVTVEDGQLVLDLGGVNVKVTDSLSVTKPEQTAAQ